MLDKIFATVSILGVIAFLGVVLVFVREPDLIIVTLIVIGIGILYIAQDLKAGGSHVEKSPQDSDSGG